MGFYERELAVTQINITNTFGTDYDQGDFVLEQGYFGNVVNQDGIANGATGVIDINSMRVVETDQTKAGDTFAVSTDETPSVTRPLEATSNSPLELSIVRPPKTSIVPPSARIRL